MKLRNFLILAFLLAGAFVGLSIYVFHDPDQAQPIIATRPPPALPPRTPVEPPPVVPPPPAVEPPVAPAADVRPVDRAVLAFVGRDLKSDKLKDATKGQTYKVNVYQDPGEATANRAKIDLDRDDKWDEKFTFKGQDVLREVAPNDDEQYTESYSWTGSGWSRR